MNTRQLYKERNKRWGTPSVWCAEWWSLSVEFCKSPEGKRQFEEWIQDTYRGGAENKLDMCYAGPHKVAQSSGPGYERFHKAALEFGISDEFMVQAHTFCASKNLCSPERTLPPPHRRRSETSVEWLARRNEELLKGCKIPPINWQELKRIAVSQYDFVRDLLEVWRTQPDMFFHDILERAASTIVSPDPRITDVQYQATMDAMRSRLHIIHMQYATWSKAIDFFQECDRRGLTGPATVMKAWKEDNAFLGRLVAMVCYATELGRWMHGKLPQVLTSSDVLRPYFHRTRDHHGSSMIRSNREYARAHPVKTTSLENCLLVLYEHGGQPLMVGALLGQLATVLRTPGEANKLTAEAYDTIGDLAIVDEFVEEIRNSSFGTALIQATQEADKSGASKEWYPLLSGISESKLQHVPYEPDFEKLGESDHIVKSVVDTWLGVVFHLDIAAALRKLMQDREFIPYYDAMWDYVDRYFWAGAKTLERAPGSLAGMFGLYAPGERRPMFMTDFLGRLWQEKEEERLKQEAAAVQAEPYVQSIPIATPQESVARAPPRAPGERKVKAKKKKAEAEGTAQTQSMDEASDQVLDTRDLPDVLPEGWKLSRKNIDIFYRLLGTEEKSGQVRWGDFEKAMKQLGFDIVQTEGSSVRFDPPAKRARPISFHRPHPDSTLNPHVLKWIGARLKRCYGWTASTFTEDPAESSS